MRIILPVSKGHPLPDEGMVIVETDSIDTITRQTLDDEDRERFTINFNGEYWESGVTPGMKFFRILGTTVEDFAEEISAAEAKAAKSLLELYESLGLPMTVRVK